MRPLVLGVLLAEATRASVGKCQGNSGSQDIIETVSAQENKKRVSVKLYQNIKE